MFTMKQIGIRTLVSLGAALVMAVGPGCSWIEKMRTPPPQQKQKQKQANRPVNAKAQKYYYDLGLQLYSKESYKEARDAFQQVVDNGPNTVLGSKAQENINKIEQILKTLEDIESK